MNLLKETIDFLEDHGKTLDDIIMFCGKAFQFTREEFEKVANVEYDNGYGSPEVALDLMLVGEGFWIERYEYDGAEGWKYRALPSTDLPFLPLHALTNSQAVAAEDADLGYNDLFQLHCCSDKYWKRVSCDGCRDKNCPLLKRKETSDE